MILNLFVGFSIFGQTWVPSQTSWLNNSYDNTIIDPANLLDNNAATNGYLSMSVYSTSYVKEMYIDFGAPKNIDGFKFAYMFPNTLRNACSNYPGDITNNCEGNLYYKNQSDQWIAAYTIIPFNPPGHNNSGGLNTIDFSMACPMTDSIAFIFPGIAAREWKFEMVGNYWLGGNFQTTTYFNVKDIYFRQYDNASIQVTTPNGTENWRVGDTHQITWNSSDVDNVKIEYSIDNGTSWTAIINDTPAPSGSYAWMVPNTPSELCLVKITSTIDPAVFDISDATFTIYIPGPEPVSIKISNAFTPNGDGINDTFGPVTTGIGSLKMSINDRNGRLVHTIDSLNRGWDGNMPSGSAAPQGVYYYLLRAMGYDNLEYIRQGNVNLYKDLITLKPNPIKSTAVLDLTGRFAGGKDISIYAVSGILMRIWNTSEDVVHLDLSFLEAGMYILKAADPEQIIVIKFIKE